MRETTTVVAYCEDCGRRGPGRRKRSLREPYVCVACRRTRKGKRPDEPVSAGFERSCDYCGSAFVGQTERSRFCCLDHAHAMVSGRLADYTSERERNAMKCHRRRLRRLAVYGEEVVPSVVFERDGWVCQLCHKPVDPTISGRYGQGATLDHIVPISLGGPHTYANVQLAHKSCNSRKHANWRGQMVLI